MRMELVVAIVGSHDLIGAGRRSQAEGAAPDGELDGSHHAWRAIEGVHQRVVLLGATLATGLEWPTRRYAAVDFLLLLLLLL